MNHVWVVGGFMIFAAVAGIAILLNGHYLRRLEEEALADLDGVLSKLDDSDPKERKRALFVLRGLGRKLSDTELRRVIRQIEAKLRHHAEPDPKIESSLNATLYELKKARRSHVG